MQKAKPKKAPVTLTLEEMQEQSKTLEEIKIKITFCKEALPRVNDPSFHLNVAYKSLHSAIFSIDSHMNLNTRRINKIKQKGGK